MCTRVHRSFDRLTRSRIHCCVKRAWEQTLRALLGGVYFESTSVKKHV